MSLIVNCPKTWYTGLVQGNKEKSLMRVCRRKAARKEGFTMEKKINATEKFCTKCGRKFLAVGREVICPSCKQAAQEESKRAAVMRAKKASWAGESVPVRISGRASTVIRRYGAAHDVPFQEALDDLLKASSFFQTMGKAWESVEPYKSRRRSKITTEDMPQEAPQAAKVTNKTSKAGASKAAGKAASKAAAGKKGVKA